MNQDRIEQILLKMQEEDKKRDQMLINVQNTLITMQEDIKERNKQVDTRFDKIDERLNQMDKRMDAMDARFDQIDKRFDQIDKRFGQNDKRFDDVEKDVSDSLESIINYFSKSIGTNNVNKFKSKSHMQILENHENRISALESKRVANQ